MIVTTKHSDDKVQRYHLSFPKYDFRLHRKFGVASYQTLKMVLFHGIYYPARTSYQEQYMILSMRVFFQINCCPIGIRIAYSCSTTLRMLVNVQSMHYWIQRKSTICLKSNTNPALCRKYCLTRMKSRSGWSVLKIRLVKYHLVCLAACQYILALIYFR